MKIHSKENIAPERKIIDVQSDYIKQWNIVWNEQILTNDKNSILKDQNCFHIFWKCYKFLGFQNNKNGV